MSTVATKKYTARVLEEEIALRTKTQNLLDTIHDRSGELSGDEEYLVIPSITPGSVASMPIDDDDMTAGETLAQIELRLNQEKGYPVIVKDADQFNTNVPLQQSFARAGAISHLADLNLAISKALADAAKAATNRKKFADATGNKITEADIIAAAAILDNAKSPADERFMAVSAEMHADLFSIPNFVSRDKMGHTGEAIPKNVIGMIHGFTVVKMPTSEMPLLNATTGAVASTGKNCVIFYQRYALVFGQHYYKLVGPEFKAGANASWYNLTRKYGLKTQNETFVVTYREN